MDSDLVAEGITKAFPTPTGELPVLHGISVTISVGDAVVIMGPSGSGKSTLLNILGTLESPTAGHLSFAGNNPFELDERSLARFRNEHIGFVFQDHHLLPQCTALENVLLPTLAFSSATSTERQRAVSLLDRVGLSDRTNHRPAELSGGERQRVAIARALINTPSFLLADEPTGNLDRAASDSVSDLLFDLHREKKVTLIAVTHSDHLASRFEKRWTLTDGRLGS